MALLIAVEVLGGDSNMSSLALICTGIDLNFVVVPKTFGIVNDNYFSPSFNGNLSGDIYLMN